MKISAICNFPRRIKDLVIGRPAPELAPKWVTVSGGLGRGIRIFVNNRCHQMVAGAFDHFIYEAVADVGFDFAGKCVWDVGAHIGYNSLVFAKVVGPRGKVIAFEPNKFNIERFRMHMKGNADLAARISLIPCAVGESECEQIFRFSNDVDRGRSAGSYIDRGTLPGDRTPSAIYESFVSERIQLVSIDELIRGRNLPVPDLMKIDVEGSEHETLLGARSLLQEQKPLLVMEIHNITCMFNVQRLLSNLGYILRLIDDGTRSASRCFILAEGPAVNHR